MLAQLPHVAFDRFLRSPLIASIVILIALVPGCSRGGFASVSEIPRPEASESSTLGPGDTFELRIYGDESLNGTYRVSGDGSVNLPLLGVVEVAGLTPAQTASRVQTLLKDRDLFRDPHVTVFVAEYASKKVTVLGAVNSPGTFPLTSGLTVLQAVTMAGGFTALADKDETILSRQHEGQTERYKIRADRVSKGQSVDVELGPGDIVFVPQRLF